MARDPLYDHADCVAACNACAASCHHCAASCLQEPDLQAKARCIGLNFDCAQICQLAVALMAGGSELDVPTCRLCAQACRSCGEECAKFQDDHCQQCAEACRRCAEECERMANA